MKKYLAIVIAVGFIGFAPHAFATYAFQRSITVTSTATVASGTNINFPMLVSSTLTSWEPTSTGGRIQNLCTAANGIQEPCDLIFSTSNACANTLNSETESYVSSTGALVAWVNVPSVSTGTLLYACYDSTSTITDQEHPSATWNPSYGGVWHFATSIANSTDSTMNANSGTNGTTTATTTQIDGGLNFNGTSSKITVPNSGSLEPSAPFTISAWINLKAVSSTIQNVIVANNSSSYVGYQFGITPSDTLQIQFGSGGSTISSHRRAKVSSSTVSTSTWHYIAAVVQGTTNMQLYLDGADAGGSLSGSGGNIAYSSDTELIGYGSSTIWNGSTFFSGSLDELRVSNVSSTPSWVLTEYNNQSSPSTFYSLGAEVTPASSTFSRRKIIIN